LISPPLRAEIEALDPLLRSSWDAYEAFLRDCLTTKNLAPGLALLERLGPEAWKLAVMTDHPLYAVGLRAASGDLARADEELRRAHLHGFSGFWRFDPQSHGWGAGIHHHPTTDRC
jgi:hypothetical protein